MIIKAESLAVLQVRSCSGFHGRVGGVAPPSSSLGCIAVTKARLKRDHHRRVSWLLSRTVPEAVKGGGVVKARAGSCSGRQGRILIAVI